MATPIQDILITSAEAAVGVTDAILEAHSFRLSTCDFPGSGFPKVSMSGTIGAIEVLLWEKIGDDWSQVFDAGAAVTLSATKPQVALQSYGMYAVSKAAATTGSQTVVTKAR